MACSMMNFGLLPHVHAVETDGDVVFMDARANQYYCIARGSAGGLFDALSSPGRFRPDLPIVGDLEAAGMFGMVDAMPARPAVPMLAMSELEECEIGCGRWRVPLRIASSALRTAMRVRFRTPEHWLRRVAARNARHAHRADPARIADIAACVREAHPFLPGFTRCLPNSLLLLEMLHAAGQPGRWVFGVRTFPFEAHCWVEHEGKVLNDRLEHVLWFTPLVAA